jgi:glycosyltransferase involved in cell wall biosynthesis
MSETIQTPSQPLTQQSRYGVGEATISVSNTLQTYKRKKINWEFIQEAQTAKNAQGNLELVKAKIAPFEAYPHALPNVSIVTITRNRKHLFPIAMQNWLAFQYPKEKLEWVIVDDSDKPDQRLDTMLEQLMQMGHDIKYVILNAVTKVGKKRNVGIEIARHQYIMMMDDDDVYYPDSILSKLSCIITYGKKIAFSRPISVHDINNDMSYVLEGFEDVPEASVMMTKEFWFNHAKFDDETESSEGHALLVGNETHAIQVPFFFNFLCLQHSENATRRLRTYNMLIGRRGREEITRMRSIKSNKNFFKELPKYFKELITQIMENQKQLLQQQKNVKNEINQNEKKKENKNKKKKKNKKKTSEAQNETQNENITETIV